MRLTVTAAVLSLAMLLLPGVASSQERPANCPDKLSGFVVGQATEQFVKACMGEPQRIDRNGPGGQYSYWYERGGGMSAPGGATLAFVFTSSGSLVRAVAYGAE